MLAIVYNSYISPSETGFVFLISQTAAVGMLQMCIKYARAALGQGERIMMIWFFWREKELTIGQKLV